MKNKTRKPVIETKFKERAKKIWDDLPACFLALGKRETPLRAKIVAAITVAYALSPIDLIPDFIPVLGQLDDIIIVPALILLTVKLIPEDILARCREEGKDMWKIHGKPKKWYFAIPIIIFWLIIILIVFLIIRSIFLK